jgi:hypothetical protein
MPPVSAPTLLLRASQPFAAMSQSGAPADWRTGLTAVQRIADAPGDHFSMLETEVSATASAIREWLAGPVS